MYRPSTFKDEGAGMCSLISTGKYHSTILLLARRCYFNVIIWVLQHTYEAEDMNSLRPDEISNQRQCAYMHACM